MLGESDNISGLNFTDHNQISYEVDNTRPLVSTLVFTETNAEIKRGGLFGKKYGENQTYVLKPGDNISLSFTTSESVDEPSILLKIGGEAIDNSSFSVQPDPIISTDGKH